MLDPRSTMPANLYRKWRLTEDRYLGMLEEQGGGCAICGTTVPGGPWGKFSIDHDHMCCLKPPTCGKCVRGILCHMCNLGLGSFVDDVKSLRSAVEYLQNYEARKASGLLPSSGACGVARGTQAGYQRHKYRKEPACDACSVANRTYNREYMRRYRSKQGSAQTSGS